MSPPDARLEPSGLVFEPQFVERVWGGTKLKRFEKLLPTGQLIGESWEISDVPGKPSRVARSNSGAQTLRDLMRTHASDLLGTSRVVNGHLDRGPQFPLLIKLLDAREDLSVQVHPSDRDLRRSGLEFRGKTEAWILLDCEPGARIVHGLASGVRRQDLIERIRLLKGAALPPAEEEDLFNWVHVERGQFVFVPAGTVHAVGKGILLLEVQQTSDITYRLYDWGRLGQDGKPRDLHLSEAQSVSDAPTVSNPFPLIDDVRETTGFTPLLASSDCDKFQIEVASLGPETPNGPILNTSTCSSYGAGFHILSPFDGESVVSTAAGDPIRLKPGHFVLVPAISEGYTISASTRTRILRFSCPT